MQRPQKVAIHGGAAQSANFVYLIIDRETKDCACVDAAWDTTGLLRVCQALELNLVAALYTHRHVDHVGGMYQEGIRLEGLSDLALAGVPALMGRADVEPTREACMLGTMSPQIVALDDGDVIPIGGIKVKALLTPGHTSGGVCFACGGDVEDDSNIEVIITGDTLFIGAFGNLENEEDAPQEMYESLQRLSKLPDMVAVLPGHNYGNERMSRIINEKQTNPAMRCTDVSQFRIVAGIDPPPEGVREISLEEAAAIAKGTKVPKGFEPQHRGGVQNRSRGQVGVLSAGRIGETFEAADLLATVSTMWWICCRELMQMHRRLTQS
jgi:glyoxylase-like metal-dependent hydrolase (beta-lactamase superfamily II)